ncbi:class I SAM-dependent methyltransferase [Tunicatimonas pelagia]|uniref:class I SAM-dependent methyltransferase n=1 Tax=Tunicatimonas pelagia TaxID=931531 RepID=UPI002666D133|nr:methyltransferase domain-containing protein [Tunicatimonas pelagia]WKN42564.1 methyltransferase domain-containing protein [Tunicatimonas pelagia]
MSSSPDVYGQALADYYYRQESLPLWVHTSYGTREEMPTAWFFRSPRNFPDLEQYALSLCQGSVLDIGAGVGSHALALQQQGFDITAIEASARATTIMTDRGVQQVQNINYRDYSGSQVDTMLMLMNGIGLVENLTGLSDFLQWAKHHLRPGGQLLFDSSDIAYLFQSTDFPEDYYYGEVQFQYEYREQYGEWFSWLYVDEQTLKRVAESCGWGCHTLFDDGSNQYLFRLFLFPG